MTNPLFNLFNQNNIMQQFNNFRNSFSGDPKEQIQKMLTSGQMTQEQFNELAKRATELRKMLPR